MPEPISPPGVALVAAGTRRYAREDLAELGQVPNSLRVVTDALRRIGVMSASPASSGLLDPDRDTLLSAVEQSVASAAVVIVYYTGHGIVVNNKYYLPMSQTRGDLTKTAVAARELVEDSALRRDSDGEKDAEQPDVLIILDCCFSTSAAIEGLISLLQGIGNDNVWIMTSANTMEYAQEGVFADALAACIGNPRTGFSQSHLSLDVLVGEINARNRAAGREQEARWFPPARRGVTGVPPFFPNLDYQPSYSGYTVEQQRHWISKVRAGPDVDSPAGFYLTARGGRMRAIEELAGFVAAPNAGRMAIVTGSPGSGKSTILAVLALLGDPQARERLLFEGRDNRVVREAAAAMGSGLEVLSIHIRGMNTTQIADIVGNRLASKRSSPAELIQHLADNATGTRPPVLIVDAIDESATPSGVIEFLVELTVRTSMRCVVGTRRHLLGNISDLNGRVKVDLDLPAYRDNEALVEYVRSLLVGANEPDLLTPYRTNGRSGEADVAGTVSVAIAERASTGETESFLMARLLALALRSRSSVVDVRESNWRNDIPDTVGAAFDEDLRRLGSHERPVRKLLTALAWAKGSGLPWETIWIPVAKALAESADSLTDDDVRWTLDHAGSYIIEDVGVGGRSVFRVFHELLAEHLRRATTPPRSAAVVGRQIFEALRAIVPTDRTGSFRWHVAHPYIRTYLAEHAHDAEGACLDELITDIGFLAAADPAALPAVLTALDSHHETVTAYLRTARLLGDVPETNTALLEESLAAVGVVMSGRKASTERGYRTVATWVRQDDAIITIRAHSTAIVQMGFYTGHDGRGVLNTIDSQMGSAQWDATSGKLLNRYFPASDVDDWAHVEIPAGIVFHLGLFGSGFIAWADQTRIYNADLRTVTLIKRDVAHREYRVCEVSVRPYGRWLMRLSLLERNAIGDISGLVTACGMGYDEKALFAHSAAGREITLIDLAAGRNIGTLTCEGDHRGVIAAMAFGTGRAAAPVLATLEGATLCVRDPLTAELVEPRYRLPARFGAEVTELGVSSNDNAVMLAAGTRTGELITVKWVDGAQSGPHIDYEGHRSWITAVSFDGTRTGSTVFATGDVRGTVRLWRGDRRPKRNRGRFDIRNVAVGAGRNSRTELAVARDDGSVTVGPIDAQDPVRVEVTAASITSMVFGRFDRIEVLAIGESSGTVQLVDLRTLEMIAVARLDDVGEVKAIRFGSHRGQPGIGVCYEDAVLIWGSTPGGRLEPVGVGSAPRGGQDSALHGSEELLIAPRGGGGGGPRPGRFLSRRNMWSRGWNTRGRGHPIDLRLGTRIAIVGERSWPAEPSPLATLALLPGEYISETRSTFTVSDAEGTRWGGALVEDERVTAVAVGSGAADSTLVAVGKSTGEVSVWELGVTESLYGSVLEHDSAVRLLAFAAGSPAPRVVTCDSGDIVRVWDLQSGRVEATLPRWSRPTHLQLYRDVLVIGEEDGWAVLEIG